MAEIRDVATVARVLARVARAVENWPKPMKCRGLARVARVKVSCVRRRARVPACVHRRGQAHARRCALARPALSTLSILGKAINKQGNFLARVR